MKRVASNSDLRKIARRRVPKMFFDYVDGGAWTEATYRANADDLARIRLKQRVAVDVSRRSAKSTILGQNVSLPIGMSPTGLTGMVWPNGEIEVLKACEGAGIPYCLSTVSIASVEDVANAASAPFWFQVYMVRDRDFIEKLIRRVEAAGVNTLVLTLDLQMSGQRNKDIHNGLSSPPKPTLRNIANLATKPAWCLNMLRYRKMEFGNLYGHVSQVSSPKSLSKWTDEQFDPTLNWDDVKRLRERWKGKLVLKGILSPEDTGMAMDVGPDAIVVSNHGGRQLDGAPSTIEVLPNIVSTVAGRCEILIDGGFTSGQDVFKGLALGADGVMMGRALLYGLGAGGRKGVAKALAMIRHELETTMGLCGINSTAEIGPENLFHKA
ncbi:alpha-hydroxy acid oxidase [Oricola indica]|uniref:alpha-hydroxy acid oxidase n=1 Tax=Oricola indica TaxID=2872591 RepID=UPI003CCB8E10